MRKKDISLYFTGYKIDSNEISNWTFFGGKSFSYHPFYTVAYSPAPLFLGFLNDGNNILFPEITGLPLIS